MTASRRILQVGLVAAMFLGSIAMWAGSPALWLWLASQGGLVSQSSMNSLLMVIVGIPVTMVLVAKLLARLDARYTESFGRAQTTRLSAARWLHSVRGGTDQEQPSMLDKVMVVSIGLAMLCFGIWFAFFSSGSQARL